MRIIVLPKGEEKEFPGRRRVADVLKALDIIPVISGGCSGEVCQVS